MELTGEENIDKLVSTIIRSLDAGIEASTPWSNPSPRSIAGFDQECKDICTEVQQLRRRWQRTRQDDDYEAYRQARNRKGRHIQKILRSTHRQRVEDASASQSGLRNLVKWAKNRHNASPACTPSLLKPDGELAHQPEEKAEVLYQSFFPPPPQADLSDIEGYQCPASIECPDITKAEVEIAVRTAPPNKAPGADGITNDILQQTLDILLPSLHKLFSACLQLGYCPRHFKETVTVVLWKQGKDDYTQPKAYRLIALLNTLGKALEAVIANRLAYLAESHDFLPSRHTGGRKLASTEHAVHFLNQRIHQAWAEGKVVSLVMLDVSGAYNNVCRERLLHNLRKRRVSRNIISWIALFLNGRSTSLKLQEYTAPSMPIQTGIPRGSRISLILYLFYNAYLIEACKTEETEAWQQPIRIAVVVRWDSRVYAKPPDKIVKAACFALKLFDKESHPELLVVDKWDRLDVLVSTIFTITTTQPWLTINWSAYLFFGLIMANANLLSKPVAWVLRRRQHM